VWGLFTWDETAGRGGRHDDHMARPQPPDGTQGEATPPECVCVCVEVVLSV